MKRYCWHESQPKIVTIVKTKMQLMLGKIYRKQMFAKSQKEFKILEI